MCKMNSQMIPKLQCIVQCKEEVESFKLISSSDHGRGKGAEEGEEENVCQMSGVSSNVLFLILAYTYSTRAGM